MRDRRPQPPRKDPCESDGESLLGDAHMATPCSRPWQHLGTNLHYVWERLPWTGRSGCFSKLRERFVHQTVPLRPQPTTSSLSAQSLWLCSSPWILDSGFWIFPYLGCFWLYPLFTYPSPLSRLARSWIYDLGLTQPAPKKAKFLQRPRSKGPRDPAPRHPKITRHSIS